MQSSLSLKRIALLAVTLLVGACLWGSFIGCSADTGETTSEALHARLPEQAPGTGSLEAPVKPAPPPAGTSPEARWQPAGQMAGERYQHTSTLLADGTVLIAGGVPFFDFDWIPSLKGAERFDPASGAWTSVTDLGIARARHTATLLPNGTVLIAGGEDIDAPGFLLSSVEIFDPSSNTWGPASDMLVPRAGHTATLLPDGTVLFVAGASFEIYDLKGDSDALILIWWAVDRAGHTATLLPDGKVLIVGGDADGTAVIFDPLIQDLVTAGTMSQPRAYHTATLLSNGTVLIAGGTGAGQDLATAEIYDPAAGTWTPTNPLSKPRTKHTATLLPEGRVLIAGGSVNDVGELYDPVAGAFLYGGQLNVPRKETSATLLQSGQVLITGGIVGYSVIGQAHQKTSTEAELFDAAGTGSWTPTGAMLAIRSVPAVVTLQDGRVLVAGGDDAGTAELYDPASDSFTSAGSMNVARHHATATRLDSGEVLVAGGDGDGTAEIYDPKMSTWKLAGSMLEPRLNHTATLLPDGRVLITGGRLPMNPPTFLDTAELYDPATKAFTSAGKMEIHRTFHTATLIPDHGVLVAGGGVTQGSLGSAEIYDWMNESWLPPIPMQVSRLFHTATPLADGKVLITGGQNLAILDINATDFAELYDPDKNSFEPAASMVQGRYGHSATLLPNGQVLVAGGAQVDPPMPSAEIYDPETGWSRVSDMAYPRNGHSTALLPNGHVVAVGGSTYPVAETFDAGGRWSLAASMPVGLVDATATLLLDGRVLVAGGVALSGPVAGAALYDPGTDAWSKTAGAMGTARARHTATLFPNGDVLIAGGTNGGLQLSSVELYLPGTDSFVSIDPMNTARFGHTATLLSGGHVLITGGLGPNGILGSVERIDPTGSLIFFLPPLDEARWEHTATLLSGDMVLIAGGRGTGGPLTSVVVFDPLSGASMKVGPMLTPHTAHTATPLPNGQILIAGGSGPNGPVATAEVYDPGSQKFTLIASMLHARAGHLAFPLENGQILVAGGYGPGGPLESAEVYDPVKLKWLPVRSLNTPRRVLAGTLLSDGRVLAVGGGNGSAPLASAELFSLLAQGALCNSASDCQSGACVDSVCCDKACGACQGCSVFTNAIPAGACAPRTGIPCNDDNACTQTDTCQAGACVGADEVSCPPDGICYFARTCDPATGKCSEKSSLPAGTTCEDDDLCKQDNRCDGAGTCQSMKPVVCPPPSDACHYQGTCNKMTGDCDNPAKEDGVPCDADGDLCTEVDHCEAGACVPGEPRRCSPFVCIKGTGECPERCASILDCEAGKVCDRDGGCVDPPPDSSNLDSSGCSVESRGASREASLLPLLGLFLLAWRRRRDQGRRELCQRRAA